MKHLHILKSVPDDNTIRLMEILKENGHKNNIFILYEGEPDYEELIDQIFEHDKVISWR